MQTREQELECENILLRLQLNKLKAVLASHRKFQDSAIVRLSSDIPAHCFEEYKEKQVKRATHALKQEMLYAVADSIHVTVEEDLPHITISCYITVGQIPSVELDILCDK